jgi:hypothetical protein
MKTTILIFSILLLAGCSKSEMVYLEKYNMFGEWERTSVMFGFYNNYEGCEAVKDALLTKFPESKYRCSAINNSLVSFILNTTKK